MGSELRWIDLRMGAEQELQIGRRVQLNIPESKRFRRLQPSICRRTLTLIFNLGISTGVIISLVLASIALKRVADKNVTVNELPILGAGLKVDALLVNHSLYAAERFAKQLDAETLVENN